jgi:hypothetical protein
MNCCGGSVYYGPTGLRLRHVCKAKMGSPYEGAPPKAVVTLPVRHPALAEPVHMDCTWHTRIGVAYVTSGSCGGPVCAAYFEAHSDDGVDA